MILLNRSSGWLLSYLSSPLFASFWYFQFLKMTQTCKCCNLANLCFSIGIWIIDDVKPTNLQVGHVLIESLRRSLLCTWRVASSWLLEPPKAAAGGCYPGSLLPSCSSWLTSAESVYQSGKKLAFAFFSHFLKQPFSNLFWFEVVPF